MSADPFTIAAGIELHRVHRATRGPAYFDAGDEGRFNPPPTHRTRYGVLYVAETDEGAFCETLGRSRYIAGSDIAGRALTTCAFDRDLNLFAVFDQANRFRYGGIDLAHDAVAVCPDYRVPQQLSALVWQDSEEHYDGIAYHCRHDNSTVSIGYAIFGEPGVHASNDVFARFKTAAIPSDLVDRMVERFKFEIVPDAPLA